MQIQLITTPQELQSVIDTAVQNAFEKANIPTSNSVIEKPITVKELCEFLGVGEQTVIRWRKKKKIPFLQLGTRVFFMKSEVISALQNKIRAR